MTNAWFPMFYRDFRDGTRKLTLEERGAYGELLMLMYDAEGAIADEEVGICAELGCDLRVWRRLRQRLIETGKIKLDGDRLYNSRAEREIEIQRRLSEQRAIAGAEGGRKSGESRRQKRAELDSLLEFSEDFGRASSGLRPDFRRTSAGLRPEVPRTCGAKFLKTKETHEASASIPQAHKTYSSTYPNGQVEQSGKVAPSPTREAALLPSEHCSKPSTTERQSEPIDSPEADQPESASAEIHQIRESRSEATLVDFSTSGPSTRQTDDEQRPRPAQASARGILTQDREPTPNQQAPNQQAIAACLAAAGPGLADPAREPALHLSATRIAAAMRAGCDLHEDIIPVIQSRTAKPRTNPITSWAYFERAWCDQRDRRLANLPAPDTARFSKEIAHAEPIRRHTPGSAGEQRETRQRAAIRLLRDIGALDGPEELALAL